MSVTQIKFLAIGGFLLGATAFGSPGATPAPSTDHLIVHEWGTFTALQDEHGQALPGVNTDDEPVPDFVHNLHSMLVQGPTQVPAVYFKGAPRSENDIYVRLETPVIYFYPPAGWQNHTVNVDVSFHGGWLTQYYPDADVQAPGLHDGRFEFGTLTDDTTGTLSWKNLSIGLPDKQGPETHDPVWLAPRQTQAAMVTTAAGESEKYLFYRGVGHIKVPLSVSRTKGRDRLEIRSQVGNFMRANQSLAMGPLWLVDVRPDGTSAVRTIDHLEASRCGDVLATLPATFASSEYTSDLSRLRAGMHEALVRDGLYSDEAEALLNTWEVSYFKRPGLRLFYMVPQAWTEHTMPLRISESADIRRVMVGRIEIVTPEQRQLLSKIAAGPVSDPAWLDQALRTVGGKNGDIYREQWYQQIMDGKRTLTSLNITIPEDYRAYLQLGRFRNALILDEQRAHSTPALQKFIDAYSLGASRSRGDGSTE